LEASRILAELPVPSTVLVLSGFPCCVNESPPTETDGPPGAYAIARAAMALGHKVLVVTDSCNEEVFAAALNNLALPATTANEGSIALECFPAELTEADQARFDRLAKTVKLIIACERAGPGADGCCYTMRGINMNEKGLIAPLDELIAAAEGVPFLAVGDGGNEVGMGKVIDKIRNSPKIANGDKIGCVVAADHLIAASVSNWGGYALAAGAALVKAEQEGCKDSPEEWIEKCLPSDQSEIELLDRCVEKGCRDGVSGKVEATVDGMSLETSLQCLRDIRSASLSSTSS